MYCFLCFLCFVFGKAFVVGHAIAYRKAKILTASNTVILSCLCEGLETGETALRVQVLIFGEMLAEGFSEEYYSAALSSASARNAELRLSMLLI